MTDEQLIKFIRESDKIEGISRTESMEVFYTYKAFLALDSIPIYDLEHFVSVCEPGARLRDQSGMNVRVGRHIFPKGGDEIPFRLQSILDSVRTGHASPLKIHKRYEALHPFTDCNGRSGRALWLWQMEEAPLGFLHEFYYQTLREGNK